MGQLDGKSIFLTGGASGIGAACADAYARAGAKVFVFDKAETALTDLLARLGPPHAGLTGDVARGEDVRRAIERAVETFGGLDAIHNNAGIAHPSKPLDETDETEWDALFSVNLKSVFFTTKHGLDALKDSRGCILNTSSLVGEIGQSLHAAYAATKGGMNALTKAMALDYAPFGVRVNAVLPAGVWTPLLREWAADQPDPAGIERYLDHIHALGYCPEADVVADACVFLLSDAARFITGCLLPVSGGADLGYRKM
jgi:NAD(P)-dependent dehydrogenase (short-subunit alcohol dehydrogenase family)